MPILELRQYTLHPGARDTLIELFEADLVHPQERCGMEIVGTFRDLDDPQRFVWIRAFADMETRARALGDFYGGPVWRRHRDRANATMLDSDNVLLLAPGWDGSGVAPLPERSSAADAGLVYAGVLLFDEPVDAVDLMHFSDELAPVIAAAGGTALACLVSEHAANTFPALPVRERDNALVWLSGFPEPPQPGLRHALEGASARWPGLLADPQLLRLAPTRTSRLTGLAQTRLAPMPELTRRRSA